MVCTRLENASSGQRSRALRVGGNRERERDRKPERERGQAHDHVAAEIIGQARERVGNARIDAAHLRPAISAPSRSARRRGVCINSCT